MKNKTKHCNNIGYKVTFKFYLFIYFFNRKAFKILFHLGLELYLISKSLGWRAGVEGGEREFSDRHSSGILQAMINLIFQLRKEIYVIVPSV